MWCEVTDWGPHFKDPELADPQHTWAECWAQSKCTINKVRDIEEHFL